MNCLPACLPARTPACLPYKIKYISFLSTPLFLSSECTAIVDAAFLIDSSGSVGRRNWARLLAFVSGMIAKLNVGPDKSHIALLRYSSGTEVDFYFDTLRGAQMSAAEYGTRIPRLRWQRGLTFIDKALIAADQELFQVRRGMRPNVPKVSRLVVLC